MSRSPLSGSRTVGALGADVEMVRLGEPADIGAERDIDQVIATDRRGRLLLAAIGQGEGDGDIAAAGERPFGRANAQDGELIVGGNHELRLPGARAPRHPSGARSRTG